MRSLFLPLALLTACTLPDEIGDYSLSISVHAGAVGPLDNVVLLAGGTPITVGGELPTAPITPAMVAAGVPPPTNVRIYGREDIPFDPGRWPAGATEATFTSEAFDYSAFNTYGVVIGWRTVNGARVYGAAELPHDSVAASNDRDTLLDVTLATGATVEVWGGDCMRLVVGEQTHYVVSLGDYDCDGLYGSADCTPTTYGTCN